MISFSPRSLYKPWRLSKAVNKRCWFRGADICCGGKRDCLGISSLSCVEISEPGAGSAPCTPLLSSEELLMSSVCPSGTQSLPKAPELALLALQGACQQIPLLLNLGNRIQWPSAGILTLWKKQ